ncbi:MAG: hypothetical protein GF419_03475 [Ignavibacteriales bacterium]|nr:hypothetical protein [Ignavibacteriales bacterium]
MSRTIDAERARGRRKYFVHSLLLPALIVIFTDCGGCPYSFTGASLPPHLETIAIPYAVDKSGSGEPGLRETFTEELIQQFIDDNNFQIADRSDADALLDCAITSVRDQYAAVTAGETAQTRRITVTVSVDYKDLVERKTLMSRQFSNYAEYAAGGGLDARKAALDEAVEKICEDITLEVVSGW